VTEPPRRLDLKAAAILILLSAAWGLNHPVTKWAYVGISPLLMGALRSALAGLGVVIWARLSGQPLGAPGLAWWHGPLIGVCFGVQFIFFYRGLELTLASRAVVMIYGQPFLTALLAHFVLPGEKLNRWRICGLVVAFVGVAAVVGHRPATGQASLAGDFFCLLAGLGWAGQNVYIRRFLAGRANYASCLYWQLLYSAPVLFLAAFTLEPAYFQPSLPVIGSILYQSLPVACLSYLVWMRLLHVYRASDLGAFTFLTPLLGVFFSSLIMGDPITAWLILGLVLVSAGVYLVNRY